MNRIHVDDLLIHRGIYDVSRCPLCKAAVEDVEHLLLHYMYAKALWDFLGNWFDIVFCTSITVVHLFLSATWM